MLYASLDLTDLGKLNIWYRVKLGGAIFHKKTDRFSTVLLLPFNSFRLLLLVILMPIFIFLFSVIGTAFALNMLFSIPVWCGVLLTGLSTLVLLALQQYGVHIPTLFNIK